MSSQPPRWAPDLLAFQGAVAGRYSIEGELGRGGMGVVFLARDVALDRPVALKLLPLELAAQPGVRERFLREARTAARLSHPNIVPIHSVDEVGDFVFFAMAYVEGGTLGERIRRRGPLSNAEAIRMLREVGWALGHAHLHGVVHRDVKPDNILLEAGTGRAMVTDFGIAGTTGVGNDESSTGLVGTAEFMSPEQARGGELDPRSDLYSLGCVGFYAYAGRVPFTGPDPAGILVQHLTAPPPRLLSVAPQAPPAVATVVDRCLRKEPELRFKDAQALAEALSPELEVVREMPVPLRVFIKESREFESILSWVTLGGVFLLFPFVISWVLGDIERTLLFGAGLAGVMGYPVMRLIQQARRLLRYGFTHQDAVSGLAQDVALRNEEYRFQVRERRTWLDRLARGVTLGGFLGTGLTWLTGMVVTLPPAVGVIGSFGLSLGFGGLIFQEFRARNRSDVMGERWLRFWKSVPGKGLFKAAGVKLKRMAALATGAHRSTEVAIGLAADRLFEELPAETRKSLKALPATVRALEEDARSVRRQVAELDAVLAEIGDDDPGQGGGEERARVRQQVVATRDEAGVRLREAVTALEKIRLGLLYMHAGSGTVESLTLDLASAKEVSEAMENLLAGHREVERLLQERRNTGVIDVSPGEGSSGGASR